MDFFIEFFVELLLEGCIELGTNKKVPAIIRYPFLFIICFCILLLLGGLLFLSLVFWKENIWFSIFLVMVDLILILSLVIKIRRFYYEKRRKML